MKGWRILTVLLLSLILVGSVACNPLGGGEEEVTDGLVEVVRGDLMITVGGSGNVEVANEIKLTFGVAGRIDKIYIDEGDEVKEGEVLATLETDALELALTQAQVAKTQAQVAVTQAQVAVTQAQVAVTQAEIDVGNAEIARYQAVVFQWPDVEVAQADVDKFTYYVEYVHERLADAPDDEKAHWLRLVAVAEEDLISAQDELNVLLSGTPPDEIVIKRQEVEVAHQSLELSQQSLELSQQSLELYQQSLQAAQQSVEVAQKQLDEATISAPFDGVVAKVAIDEKDTVLATTTIIHLIDPSSMELEVEVDEIDIPDVKLMQRAIIEVDALPSLPLEGEVSSISLLPTEQAGVIVYEVKIEFDVPEDVGIRAGMSATTDIVVAERSNVLLVPDRAIGKDNEGNTIVEVTIDGQTDERIVVTGISDGFQTEILGGLEEGEVVERRAKPK
ncbi:efflux RND transporter periplasmic adaptor subunit [Chloroflexota bacterium]